MRRYSCISVTGYEIVDENEGNHPLGRRRYRSRFGQSRNDPTTTWYVVDEADMGRVVAAYDNEDDAREDVFLSNAEERRWQKTRQHLIEDLTS